MPEFFLGCANKDDQVSIFRAVGALGREQVWRGHVKDANAAMVRVAFDDWFSEGGKWPAAVERSGDGYKLMQAHSAWVAWQAARKAKP